MSESTQRFLTEITTLSRGLAEAHQETIEYWAPDLPPVTVAYAEIGHKLVDEFEEIDTRTRTAVFHLIEEGMEREDEELGTAVATGLIEGMAGRAARRGNWDNVRAELGPLSRSHADAWLAS